MATNLADSRRNAIQYQFSKMMASPENRIKPTPFVQKLIKNTEMLVSAKNRMNGIFAVKESDQDTVEVVLIEKNSSASLTGRSSSHSGTTPKSKKKAVTFVTRGDDFNYSLKGADRDAVFSNSQLVSRMIMNCMLNTLSDTETYMAAQMAAAKSQSANTPTLGTWDGSNNKYYIGNTDKNYAFQRFEGFMREQYLKAGMYDLVANEPIIQLADYLANQGAGNGTNSAFQLSRTAYAASSDISLNTGAYGNGYIMPAGTAGMLNWIPRQNVQGFGNTFQNGGMYYSLQDPWGLGLTFAVHEYAAGSDQNANDGEKQDVLIYVEVTTDVAFVVPDFSTSNWSPIYEVEIKN